MTTSAEKVFSAQSRGVRLKDSESTRIMVYTLVLTLCGVHEETVFLRGNVRGQDQRTNRVSIFPSTPLPYDDTWTL